MQRGDSFGAKEEVVEEDEVPLGGAVAGVSVGGGAGQLLGPRPPRHPVSCEGIVPQHVPPDERRVEPPQEMCRYFKGGFAW